MRGLVRQAAMGGGLLCFCAGVATAQTLTVSGSPAAMTISTAVAGFPPTDATNSGTTYRAAAAKKTKPQKIMAQLNANMPAGMTLTINLVAPTGATSDGTVTLDATARELVGNITNTAAQTNTITYVLSATAGAGVVLSQSRTVTFTITSWP